MDLMTGESRLGRVLSAEFFDKASLSSVLVMLKFIFHYFPNIISPSQGQYQFP